jgi:hypothetical protein
MTVAYCNIFREFVANNFLKDMLFTPMCLGPPDLTGEFKEFLPQMTCEAIANAFAIMPEEDLEDILKIMLESPGEPLFYLCIGGEHYKGRTDEEQKYLQDFGAALEERARYRPPHLRTPPFDPSEAELGMIQDAQRTGDLRQASALQDHPGSAEDRFIENLESVESAGEELEAPRDHPNHVDTNEDNPHT